MDTSRSSFKYAPLDVTSHEIRLVRIVSPESAPKLDASPPQPQGSEPLTLSVSHFKLSSCPPFIALSYTWGQTTDRLPVTLNGGHLRITRNLEGFLRQAANRQRRTGSIWGSDEGEAGGDDGEVEDGELIWIDAICIDQQNIQERNDQIPLMKEIFERARHVAIWLGPEEDESRLAMIAIRRVAQELRLMKEKGEQETEEKVSSVFFVREEEAIWDRQWGGIGKIFKRPWWSRAWVLQEATTPDKWRSIVFCGDQSALMEDLSDVYYAAGKYSYLNRRLIGRAYSSASGVLDILRLKGARERKFLWKPITPTDLLSLLDGTRFRKAKDPRDRIYSLLGIATDQGVLKLRADYSLAVTEVYTVLASRMLETSRNLDVLTSSRVVSTISGLPSWVPDWAPQNKALCLRRIVRNMFSASGTIESVVKIIEGGRKLHISGVQFDIISSMSEPRIPSDVERENDWQDYQNKQQDIISTWKEMATSNASQNYPTGGTTISAFEHALCIDLEDLPDHQGCRRGGSFSIENIETGVISNRVKVATVYRRLSFTQRGYVGLVPIEAEVGDVVCVLFGGQTPFILRQVGEHWLIVGDCYVHGIMDGEAIVDAEKREREMTTFEIW